MCIQSSMRPLMLRNCTKPLHVCAIHCAAPLSSDLKARRSSAAIACSPHTRPFLKPDSETDSESARARFSEQTPKQTPKQTPEHATGLRTPTCHLAQHTHRHTHRIGQNTHRHTHHIAQHPPTHTPCFSQRTRKKRQQDAWDGCERTHKPPQSKHMRCQRLQ